MRLPEQLQEAIDQEASRLASADIARASAHLTDVYKNGHHANLALNSAALRIAYLRVRAPATFAACQRVFQEIRERAPECEVASVLDLGAGPGTAMWAAAQVFPEISSFTLVERDGELIEMGRRIAYASTAPAIRSARWLRQDLGSTLDVAAHDLVVVSYALGEFSAGAAAELVRKAWSRTSKLLVVIEPGTPRNFAGVLAVRSALIDSGACVVAPCPHARQCPMAEAADWCHFSQRLERTAEHRRIKGGMLAYEDEKFSYFVAAKFPVNLPSARIVRHPMKHTGHVQLTLCTPNGLERTTIGKSKKEQYRAARKAEWGDAWQQDDNLAHPL